MSLISTPRAGSVRTIKFDKRPLQAVKVIKGGLAACNAGFYGPAIGDPDDVIVGRFYETVDNSAGSPGDKKANIQFFRERKLFLVDNDTGSAVVVADREKGCSFLDDHTATTLNDTNGLGAFVYDVTTEGVWIEFLHPAAPEVVQPSVQAGTTTLVTGTKSVTGVTLTATSRILLTMKDPGSGAITGFAALDAPAGSRNTGAGSFVINAIDDAKAVITTAVCTVDYLIVG